MIAELYEGVRWANAFIATVLAIALAFRIWHSRETLPLGGKRFLVGLLILLATIAYGSLEAYLTGAGSGLRIVFVLAALLGLVHGLYASHHDAD